MPAATGSNRSSFRSARITIRSEDGGERQVDDHHPARGALDGLRLREPEALERDPLDADGGEADGEPGGLGAARDPPVEVDEHRGAEHDREGHEPAQRAPPRRRPSPRCTVSVISCGTATNNRTRAVPRQFQTPRGMPNTVVWLGRTPAGCAGSPLAPRLRAHLEVVFCLSRGCPHARPPPFPPRLNVCCSTPTSTLLSSANTTY